jgi:hypothetical protein
MLKQKRCQAGHAKRGRGWILFFRRKYAATYRRCLNKSSVNVKNEEYSAKSDPAIISLCAECNRTLLDLPIPEC